MKYKGEIVVILILFSILFTCISQAYKLRIFSPSFAQQGKVQQYSSAPSFKNRNQFIRSQIAKNLPVIDIGNTTCTLTAAITGNSCVGSTLTATGSEALTAINWKLNGTTVASQTATLQNTGVVVAGGNGVGPSFNQLSSPDRFYIDHQGNIYVPELGNSRVTKWVPGATSGIIVAGGSGYGRAANQLSSPTSVVADELGNVFVCDRDNNRIQRWAAGANSGTTIADGLNYPTGIFIDSQGNIYVSEQHGLM